MVNGGDFISDSCSGREVLEVSDVLSEFIVGDAIRMSERLLGKFGEFKVGYGLGIKREKDGIEVFNKLVKGFLS